MGHHKGVLELDTKKKSNWILSLSICVQNGGGGHHPGAMNYKGHIRILKVIHALILQKLLNQPRPPSHANTCVLPLIFTMIGTTSLSIEISKGCPHASDVRHKHL